MASNHYLLELEPLAERLRHAPHGVISGGGFAGVHASAVADLHDFKIFHTPGPAAVGHRSPGLDPRPREPDHLEYQMAMCPANRQRASFLLTGMPRQHLALDVEDAYCPMDSDKGSSIAEPDDLKAAKN